MESQYEYSSSVISHLHDLKASYQRNMVVALLSVFVLGAVPLSIICLIAEDKAEDRAVAVSSIEADNQSPTVEFEVKAADMRPSKYTHQKGFAGFKGYAIAREPSYHRGYVFANNAVSLNARLFSIEFSDRESSDQTYTLASDFDENYGIPPSSTFFDIVPSTRWTLSWSNNGSIHRSVTGSDSPPLLKLADVRHPRKGWHVNGIVTVVFVIDEDGSIAEYQVVLEEPKGHDFAQALKEAINESVFFPAIDNGEEIPFRLTLTYEFCWECSEPTGVQLSDGVIVRRKPF